MCDLCPSVGLVRSCIRHSDAAWSALNECPRFRRSRDLLRNQDGARPSDSLWTGEE